MPGCPTRPWWCWPARRVRASRPGPRSDSGPPRSSPPMRCGQRSAADRPISTRPPTPSPCSTRSWPRGPGARLTTVIDTLGLDPERRGGYRRLARDGRAARRAGDHEHPGRALPAAQPGPRPAGAGPGDHRAAAPGPAADRAAQDEGWDQVLIIDRRRHGDASADRAARRLERMIMARATRGRRGDPAGLPVPVGRGPDRLAGRIWPWPRTPAASPASP